MLNRERKRQEDRQSTMNQLNLSLPGLSPISDKEIVARFDGGRPSSDGGVVLLCEIEARLGLAARLTAGLVDGHHPERINQATPG